VRACTRSLPKQSLIKAQKAQHLATASIALFIESAKQVESRQVTSQAGAAWGKLQEEQKCIYEVHAGRNIAFCFPGPEKADTLFKRAEETREALVLRRKVR